LGIQKDATKKPSCSLLYKRDEMTHFTNADEREIFEAINLLKDDNLVWSSDLEAIRRNLARLLERIMQVEWHYLEPEIGDLALNLIRETERENHARRNDTDTEETELQGKVNLGIVGCKGSGNTCQCSS
jgi:regulator of replication initiation timing